jgi:hypothetical protein
MVEKQFMSAPQNDPLIERTIRDFKSGNSDAVQHDLSEILLRDTDARNPANNSPADVAANLAHDADLLHTGTGMTRGALEKLGFPDPLMEDTIHEVKTKHIGAALRDAQRLLARDGKTSEADDKQLKDDHERLHAAGVRDDLLVRLGFPKPDAKPQQ